MAASVTFFLNIRYFGRQWDFIWCNATRKVGVRCNHLTSISCLRERPRATGN